MAASADKAGAKRLYELIRNDDKDSPLAELAGEKLKKIGE